MNKTSRFLILLSLLSIINYSQTGNGIEQVVSVNPSSRIILHETYEDACSGHLTTDRYLSVGVPNTGIASYYAQNGDCGLDERKEVFRTAFKVTFVKPEPTAILTKVEIGILGDGGEAVELTSTDYNDSYEKLFDAIGSNSQLFTYGSMGDEYDVTDYAVQFLSSGSFYFGIKKDSYPTDVVDVVCYQTWEYPANFEVKNNFDAGDVSVNDQSVPSGTEFDKWLGRPVDLLAIEQTYANYSRIWNDTEAPINPSKWEKIDWAGQRTVMTSNISYSLQVAENDHNSTYEAGLRKVCNISFSNQFSGTNYGGQIKVNGGAWENAPTTQRQVVEQNLITAEAKSRYTINGIQYDFQNWSDGSTLSSQTFTPSNHTTYTAYYTGRPENSYRNLHDIGAVGQPIVLDWDEHPDTAVTQYKIYRKVAKAASIPEQLIGTKSRGTTTFTDNRYTKSRTLDEYLLSYDVRAYYSTEGTYSNPDFIVIYGGPPLPKISDTTFVAQDIPKDYSLSNYPNPFNPTTVIEYQLPKAGYVEIKVYDAIGKEVATLVNEEKEIGRYQTRFGSNDLPSGMYIYTIKVNDYFASKKMLLIK